MPKEIIESSSNSELVLELVELLRKEASLFETFLELLERQQKALVKNDISVLNEITERQREKIVETRILAERREILVKRLSARGDLRENLTITRLIESVSSNQAMILEELRQTIFDLNEKISKIRTQNEMLINHSRENIMKTMELLGRIKISDHNYHSEGKLKSVPTNLALDRRV
ncbi:MAG: flagellar protein FlgN [candidate division Zixibacteria bacterium]|nr:flagellar protein FlgN [candidate division Zixibacteria bacterium]